MVVDDFNVMWAIVMPRKTDTPLVKRTAYAWLVFEMGNETVLKLR